MNKILIPLLFLVSGCATVIAGKSQEIQFVNQPGECSVNQQLIPLDGKVEVPRQRADLEIRCGEKGKLVSYSVHPAAWVSIFLLDGGLTDLSTGAMWTFPNEIDLSDLR